MTHQELIQLLVDKGFIDGWALGGDELLVWEHEENPPKPLARPEA